MKRILVVFLAVVGLSSASAQSDLFVGGGLNLEFGGFTLVSLDAQVGDYGLFGSFGGRAILGLGFSPSVYLKTAADVILPFEVDSEKLTPYAGGGLGLITRNGTAVNIHALGGAEYAIADQFSLFGEVVPGVYLNGGDFTFGLRLGANYQLD